MNKRNLVLLVLFILLVGGFLLKNWLDEKRVRESIAQENEVVLAGLTKEQITEVTIKDTEKNTVTTLVKSGDRWTVKEKGGALADKSLADKVAETLPKIRFGQKIGPLNEETKKKYGFEKAVEVAVQGKTLLIGQPVGVRLPIAIEGTIYLSPNNERYTFARYDGEWRDRSLFPGKTSDDVSAVTVTPEGGKEIKVTINEKGEATITGVEGGEPQKGKTFVNTVGGLRISNFADTPPETVTDIEKDKKKVSIAKGTVLVEFKNGDKVAFELTGLKVKDKSDYLIRKDGKLLGISEYYYNKLASPELGPTPKKETTPAKITPAKTTPTKSPEKEKKK